MYIEEKYFMVPAEERKPSLWYLSGLCGSGKTEIVCRKIADEWRHRTNILYVAPTIQLIEEVRERLQRMNVSSIAIHSDVRSDKTVPSQIMDHLKNAPDTGDVLIITWNSYQMLPFFPGREKWKIIIDEVPQVDELLEFALPHNPEFIKDEVVAEPCGLDGLLAVRAKARGALEKRMEKDKDTVHEVFRRFYACVTSKNHEVFVRQVDWKRFREGDGSIRFLAMIRSSLFENSLLLGANVESSLLLKWLKKRYTIKIRPDDQLVKQLRYRNHSFGDRAQVFYFEGVDSWSKCLRDKGNNIWSMDEAVRNFFGDRKFLVVSNNDHRVNFENGFRIPVVCHGLDSYKDITGIYISAALNRSTHHVRLLNSVGFTSDDIRIATSVETYYQSVMRTNLRVRESTEPVDIIVPDSASATSLRELLSSSKIRSIACPLTLGPKALTKQQRNLRYKERRALQRNFPERRQDFFSDKKNSLRLGNSSPYLKFTIHASKCDINEKQFPIHIQDEQSFIALLRSSSKTPRITKEEARLINAGIYENRVELKPGESFKRSENFVQSSFLMLDFDNGTISPKDFITMFGSKAPVEDRVPFVITNTFSTSPANPNRFRVFVLFVTPAITVQEHNATYDLMVSLMVSKGWTKELLGLDPGTRSPVLSCYLPGTNLEYAASAFFETHNTKSREIQQFGLVPSWIPLEEEQQFQPNLDDSAYGSIPQDIIDHITAEFRSMSEGRHRVFFYVGLNLARARHQGKRLSPPDIEGILRSLATEKHYRRKVKDVMRSLRRYRRL